ncbi:unnamed protein product [Owenia fusiformis]|uniref:Beta-lactamase-related domain-containing protein n=1 Tax=Owenia fusiformis TaxID=6347 RepID=A0A8S4P385_OWEFU|nr:unnamed protein product [Owenia fusiformis]
MTIKYWIFLLFTYVSAQTNKELVINNLVPFEEYVDTPGRERETQTLQQRMEKWFVPSVSIAVINNYQIDWSDGFGLAQPSAGANDNTLYQAGTLSSFVSAIATLALSQQGRLDLEADVNTLLGPSFKIKYNDQQKDGVKLKHLLSHNGGISELEFEGYPQSISQLPTLLETLRGESPANNLPIEVEEDFLGFEGKPVRQGVEEDYSSGAYAVLQQLLKDQTGQDFKQLVQTEVLGKASMSSSTFDIKSPSNAFGVAYGYDCISERDTVVPGNWWNFPESAAQGLWTNVKDLANLVINIAGGKSSRPGSILNAATTAKMLTKQTRKGQGNPPANENGMFGIGTEVVDGQNGNTWFVNTGYSEGYCSEVIGNTDGRGLVLMSNQDCARGHFLLGEIFRAVAQVYNWQDAIGNSKIEFNKRMQVRPAPPSPQPWEGNYVIDDIQVPPLLKGILEDVVGRPITKDDLPFQNVYVTSSMIQPDKHLCSMYIYPCARPDKIGKYCTVLTIWQVTRAKLGDITFIPDGPNGYKAEFFLMPTDFGDIIGHGHRTGGAPTRGPPGGTTPSPGDRDRNKNLVIHNLLPFEHYVDTPGRTDETQNLEQRMQKWFVPGVSIAVIKDYQVDWADGFGMAQPGVSASADTLYQAGTLSSFVSSIAALSLVQKGQLNLEADVNTLLQNFKMTYNGQQKDGVKLRHILAHNGGIDIDEFDGYKQLSQLPTLMQTLNGQSPANNQKIGIMEDYLSLDPKPVGQGVEEDYSSGGFAVLQQILEDQTSQSFVDLVQNEVFGRARMVSSSFEIKSSQYGLAFGYDCVSDRDTVVEGNWWNFPESAAQGLWTNVIDLAKLVINIAGGKNSMAGSILNPSITAQMLTKQTKQGQGNPPALENGIFGLGTEVVDGQNGNTWFVNTGYSEGYCSEVIANTDGRGLVMMSNQDCARGHFLLGEIFRAVSVVYNWQDAINNPNIEFNSRMPVKPAPSFQQPWEGNYMIVDIQVPEPLKSIIEGIAGRPIKREDLPFQNIYASTTMIQPDKNLCSMYIYPCANPDKIGKYCTVLTIWQVVNAQLGDITFIPDGRGGYTAEFFLTDTEFGDTKIHATRTGSATPPPSLTTPSPIDREMNKQLVIQNLLPFEHYIHTPGRTDETQTLAQRMEKWFVPGVSIAVINNYQIDWADGFGMAQPGVPASADTIYQAGTLSSFVSAIATLSLVEQGQLDLEADVNTLLRSWKMTYNNQQKDGVKLKHLLAHNGGLTVLEFDGYQQSSRMPNLLQTLNGQSPANNEKVAVSNDLLGFGDQPLGQGEQEDYSSGGYAVLQQILEDQTNQPFKQLVQRLVLDKASMRSSTFDIKSPSNSYGIAYGYDCLSDKDTLVPGKWWNFPESAAQGLWTNVNDLANLVINVAGGKNHMPGSILNPTSTNNMLTKQTKNGQGNPPATENGMFGLGTEVVDGQNGDTWFVNTGYSEGYCSEVIANTDGRGLVVMSNQDCARGHFLLGEIFRAVSVVYNWNDAIDNTNIEFNRRIPVFPPPKTKQPWEGMYSIVDIEVPEPLKSIVEGIAGRPIKRDDLPFQNVYASTTMIQPDKALCSMYIYPCANSNKVGKYCTVLTVWQVVQAQLGDITFIKNGNGYKAEFFLTDTDFGDIKIHLTRTSQGVGAASAKSATAIFITFTLVILGFL